LRTGIRGADTIVITQPVSRRKHHKRNIFMKMYLETDIIINILLACITNKQIDPLAKASFVSR